MNDNGHWRLACINLDAGTVTTYDPMWPTDRLEEEPPHFAFLKNVLAPEAMEWCHVYGIYPDPIISIQQTGAWILRTLDCIPRKQKLSFGKVHTS